MTFKEALKYINGFVIRRESWPKGKIVFEVSYQNMPDGREYFLHFFEGYQETILQEKIETLSNKDKNANDWIKELPPGVGHI